MAWGKAGSTTLSSSGDSIDVSSLSDNKCNQMLIYGVSSGAGNTSLRFNNDSGSNYAKRRSHNGLSDSTATSQTSTNTDGFTSRENFDVAYMVNISSEEKLIIRHTVDRETAGAGTAPARIEVVSKWANTSDTVDQITVVNTLAGDLTTDSNLTVLGSELTPAAAITFPTNVQVGSRAEITDTRKMYNYTNPLTFEDDFSTDNFDTQGTKNQVNTGTGVIDFDFNRDGSNHKTKIDTTLGNEFVVRWTQTWDNIAYNSGNPIGFIGLGNTAETVNILSTTNDFLGFEIIVDNSGVVELRAVSAIGESIFSSNHDDTLTKSPAENETLGYEIIRYSDTDWKINIYDSTFTTLEDTTGLLTTASSSLDTTNFMVATYPSSSQTSQGDGTIDNLEVYNGVTQTTNTWQEIGA